MRLRAHRVADRAQADQPGDEAQQVGVALGEAPVEPARLVVLAVGVVVAALRAAHLVAHQQHRRAERQQVDRQQVARLAAAQGEHVGVVGGALGAAVPAQVVVGAVAVVFAVGLVVLAVVRHQVLEREAVVAGDEVDALRRLARARAVQVGAAEQAVGQPRDGAVVAAHEGTHVVAEVAVPLLPAVADEVADLVQAGGVPRLGDQLGAGEHGVGLDVPQHRRVGQRVALLVAREDRREVEAETVDVHHLDPVVQAVEDQPAHDGVVGVERVAAAGEVLVAALGVEHVVRGVLEPAQRQRRPAFVAFGAVVEDDVEDHLDAGAVQRLDHVAELVEHGERLAPRRVAGVRREPRDRRVAPVVGQPRRGVERVVLEHRQQLDRGHAERFQVRNLVDDAGVGAAPPRGDARVRVRREAAHVHLVDHGLRERATQRCVAFPVVAVDVGDDALAGVGVVAAGQVRGVAAVVRRHGDGAAVGVEQHLVGVEAQTALGRERPVRAPGVELTRLQSGHEDVAVVVRAVPGVQRVGLRRLARVDVVVKEQLDAVGAAAVDAEVDAAVARRRAERVRQAGFGRVQRDGHGAQLACARRHAA